MKAATHDCYSRGGGIGGWDGMEWVQYRMVPIEYRVESIRVESKRQVDIKIDDLCAMQYMWQRSIIIIIESNRIESKSQVVIKRDNICNAVRGKEAS